MNNFKNILEAVDYMKCTYGMYMATSMVTWLTSWLEELSCMQIRFHHSFIKQKVAHGLRYNHVYLLWKDNLQK